MIQHCLIDAEAGISVKQEYTSVRYSSTHRNQDKKFLIYLTYPGNQAEPGKPIEFLELDAAEANKLLWSLNNAKSNLLI